jgi:hypothetical protein
VTDKEKAQRKEKAKIAEGEYKKALAKYFNKMAKKM